MSVVYRIHKTLLHSLLTFVFYNASLVVSVIDCVSDLNCLLALNSRGCGDNKDITEYFPSGWIVSLDACKSCSW
jgi:hypothetical protein